MEKAQVVKIPLALLGSSGRAAIKAAALKEQLARVEKAIAILTGK
jgi:hypothetical protein